MALTYEAIATVTVGSGGAANIEFTSIPGTYTDLVVKVSARTSVANGTCTITFNNSTSSYSYRYIYGSGSATSSGSASTSNIDGGVYNWSASTANTFANAEIYIPNYAGSNNKSASLDTVSENNATEAYADLGAGLWSNTAAITSITLTPNLGNFVQYSTATLFGIKNTV